MDPWTLQDRGRSLTVEVSADGDRNHAVLSIDGERVADGHVGALESVVLRSDDVAVAVDFWWGGRPRGIHLLEQPDGEPVQPGEESRHGLVRIPFTPPPGTRAARRHAWREAHPRLWAARHVALEGAGILAGLLGISALVGVIFGRLLPTLDWSWLPEISPPDWLRYLDPLHWLRQVLPDVDWFGWVPDLPDLGWLKYVVALAIATAVGVREVRRRREREARERSRDSSTDS